ncbi:MAG: beta-galactosidase [Spirochaetota bacterium]|nr:beta-galactosidase [Spirochaetota bacterium]
MNNTKDVISTINGTKDVPKANDGIEIIQQWQYIGNVHPHLLEDKAFEYAKRSGITSVQSYVSWAEIEKVSGIFNFSAYDVLIDKLKKYGLKWVPFLILGPNYSIPEWFHESDLSIYATCLEHGEKSKIQSIWNPFLSDCVERFIGVFAEHYRDKDIIESILLGISGNWGEAIFPVTGGFRGGFHTHQGWWCGDNYAYESYQNYLKNKYGNIKALNHEYHTSYSTFSDISFPVIVYNIKDAPNYPMKVLRFIKYRYHKYKRLIFNQLHKRLPWMTNPLILSRPSRWKEYLEFVSWYQNEMTKWAEFWIKTARTHFPGSKIYLVTGGDGAPWTGAVFSEQTKMAKKYNTGIRITNQTDDYSESFILTRLVSSASRFYKTYFITEEAWINSPNGVIARIFDAASSGARGFYCKNIIGTGVDLCSQREFPVGLPTKGAVNLINNISHMSASQPIIDAAVLFPNTSIALGTSISDIYSSCSQLRNYIDIDLVDETMISDGALYKNKYLVIFQCPWLRDQHLREIIQWISDGGILIYPKYTSMTNIDDNKKSFKPILGKGNLSKVKQGCIIRFNGYNRQNYINFIIEVIANKNSDYPFIGSLFVDIESDNVYTTYFNDKIILYNSNDLSIKKNLTLFPSYIKSNSYIDIEPDTIVSIEVEK